MARVKNTIEDISVCEGIKLSKAVHDAKENRLLTLLVKGLVVYLLSMGSIGFYLSTLNIKYNVILCHAVIFVMALVSAMLYYRLLTENIGYLIVLVAFCLLVYSFRTYINSGFYAIVNITMDLAAQFFNIDIQRVYDEQITNRNITINFAVLFIGIVLDIFLNVYISRRMQYVTVIFVIMGLNMIPLYLVAEPDNVYVVMVLGGVALAYVFRSGKHYSPQVSSKRDDIKFKEKGKKKEIAYVYDVKAMVNAGIIAFSFVMVLVPVVTAFKPKDSFNVAYTGNKYKDLSMVAVKTVLMDGVSSLFVKSEDVGGLDSGKLGSVPTVRLDYKTDLVIQFAPYNYERLYLKGFTGGRYNPYENQWSNILYSDGYDRTLTPEASSLKKKFEEGYEYSSEATIRVKNVESDILYKPYYFYDFSYNRQFVDMVFYPRLMGNESYVDGEEYQGLAYKDSDLYVPEENLEAVEKIAKELGYPIEQDEIINGLIDYYQENFPYTIQPGKTPYNQDFVNDFLLEKKRGYCAHYASAAVLIFRYLGIPARYVEGYAVDYEQVYNGELVENAKYSDYYKGYSEIGETALVSVNVTDADAHAWVEVYDYQTGWTPVEVTPYATLDEEEQEDFWSMFADIMDDTGTSEGVDDAAGIGGVDAANEVIKNILYGICAVLILGVVGLLLIKLTGYIRYLVEFMKADLNDKLVLRYQRVCRGYKKKFKEFREKINYRQQIEYILEIKKQETITDEIKKSQEKVIAILEKAGFSQDMISPEEYEYVNEWCKANFQ